MAALQGKDGDVAGNGGVNSMVADPRHPRKARKRTKQPSDAGRALFSGGRSSKSLDNSDYFGGNGPSLPVIDIDH
jgi:hypothetical protein